MCIKTYEGLIGNQGYSFFPAADPTFLQTPQVSFCTNNSTKDVLFNNC